MTRTTECSRRRFFVGAGVAGMAISSASGGSTADIQKPPNKTFVLVHGSWHGGWLWQRVASRLRAQGHLVFTPSFTGMGDRKHLLSRDITIDTFVEDVAEVIDTEELSDVILVGHSFGGVAITGVADRAPEKLKHLVYLDAIVIEGGQTAFSSYPPKEVERRIAAANAANGGLAVPTPKSLPASWGLTEGTPDYAWVKRRLTPTPLRAYTTPLNLHSPIGNGVPKTYVRCSLPEDEPETASRSLVRSQTGWNWIDFPGPHHCLITQPDEISKLLLQI